MSTFNLLSLFFILVQCTSLVECKTVLVSRDTLSATDVPLDVASLPVTIEPPTDLTLYVSAVRMAVVDEELKQTVANGLAIALKDATELVEEMQGCEGAQRRSFTFTYQASTVSLSVSEVVATLTGEGVTFRSVAGKASVVVPPTTTRINYVDHMKKKHKVKRPSYYDSQGSRLEPRSLTAIETSDILALLQRELTTDSAYSASVASLTTS
jgi:hypothetical protein